jgi:hypothetical protein
VEEFDAEEKGGGGGGWGGLSRVEEINPLRLAFVLLNFRLCFLHETDRQQKGTLLDLADARNGIFDSKKGARTQLAHSLARAQRHSVLFEFCFKFAMASASSLRSPASVVVSPPRGPLFQYSQRKNSV